MSLNAQEQSALQFATADSSEHLEETDQNILAVGFKAALHAGRLIQTARAQEDFETEMKDDQSKVTNVDRNGELLIASVIKRHFKDHQMTGEELHHAAQDHENFSWGVDPVDGTNAFTMHETGVSVSISVMKGNQVKMGLVYAPFYGRLFYALGDQPSRLLEQQANFGVQGYANIPHGYNLPIASLLKVEGISINLHPRTTSQTLHSVLQKDLHRKDLGRIREVGGSIAAQIANSVKGNNAFVCDWGKKPAAHHDLAAAAKIARNAKGSVINFDGNDIPNIGHTGLLIASISKELNLKILKMIRESVGAY